MLAAQGRWVAAIALAVWGVVVVGLVDNIIRPKRMVWDGLGSPRLASCSER